INIMRLVGASNSFIKGPFVVEGILYGVISAVISFLILLPVVAFISPHLSKFVHEINLSSYLASNWGNLVLYQLAFALALAILSSAFAIRKYLRK
ncbi:MAG: FtsX-like permease family protein, partial [Candidatus Wolfebacteria bacterium]|nr:FtsX-like permease family protein [Candidatus Wolfebacteria bacterium]